ncbi:MAG: HEAT repeat domain-containing protein [Cocleimonas sp.]|nr:HEAT repeat domain-containing protein [Cocleimonas sp.]
MTNANEITLDVLLIISSSCPHCPSVLDHLTRLIKLGEITKLTIINIEQHPFATQKYNIRSVPWIKIGKQQLQGLQTLETIRQHIAWAKDSQNLSAEFDFLLSDGQANNVTKQIEQDPSAIHALLELLGNDGTVLSTRIGIGVVMEDLAESALLRSVIPQLETLTQHPNAPIRSDACHYLGLSHDPSVRPLLENCLNDSNADVREIAQDGLDELND